MKMEIKNGEKVKVNRSETQEDQNLVQTQEVSASI